jgi:2-polyprenyl-3-methyl-5-hydroxy-6-metoxy-1,4-benzoquinol methylase
MELYKNKENHYFSNTRNDLISLLPRTGIKRLLELGAGGCDTLVEIKKSGLAAEVVGVELMNLPGTNQENPLIDKLLIGDFEALEGQLEPSSFDVIICGDVLEHLINPWEVMKRLTALLKPGGEIIISTPNARYYGMFVKIFIKGSFKYTDSGIFDRTHLRFFCKRDIIELATQDRLKITSITPSFTFHRRSISFIVNRITLGILEQFLAIQYVVAAKLQ